MSEWTLKSGDFLVSCDEPTPSSEDPYMLILVRISTREVLDLFSWRGDWRRCRRVPGWVRHAMRAKEEHRDR